MNGSSGVGGVKKGGVKTGGGGVEQWVEMVLDQYTVLFLILVLLALLLTFIALILLVCALKTNSLQVFLPHTTHRPPAVTRF